MKNIAIYRLFILAFTLACFTQFAQAQDRKNEIQKKINKQYSVDKNVLVDLSNRYGEVRVNTWQKNEVTIEVTVKAWGNNPSQAQEYLDRVTINYNNSSDYIKFETNVGNNNSNWKRGGFEINYLVNMPAANPLKLINKYGATYVGDLQNDVDVIVAYGSFTAGNLSGSETEIDVSYGSAEIASVKDGEINTKYCKFLNVKEGKKLSIVDKYGRVEIGEIDELDIELGYSKLDIERVSKLLKVYAKYSGGRIENVVDGFEEIYIKTSYGSFDIGLDDANNFEFEVETRYGNFKNSTSGLDIKKQIIHNTSQEYAGVKGNGSAKISVYASYGSVKFQ
ncbi:hypothetical protein R9C00_22185 [Flammeovirgaceae bacterium SG7u.111]|nr:hypothetical protein [Flammeovirgaceae bacterium SG7u.132]WPO34414.1 hypothetical protein R9C00_22185 [Flammeovirgaceae bacterium SG7u.111]